MAISTARWLTARSRRLTETLALPEKGVLPCESAASCFKLHCMRPAAARQWDVNGKQLSKIASVLLVETPHRSAQGLSVDIARPNVELTTGSRSSRRFGLVAHWLRQLETGFGKTMTVDTRAAARQ